MKNVLRKKGQGLRFHIKYLPLIKHLRNYMLCKNVCFAEDKIGHTF